MACGEILFYTDYGVDIKDKDKYSSFYRDRKINNHIAVLKQYYRESRLNYII